VGSAVGGSQLAEVVGSQLACARPTSRRSPAAAKREAETREAIRSSGRVMRGTPT
jgi:hypothetical protein